MGKISLLICSLVLILPCSGSAQPLPDAGRTTCCDVFTEVNPSIQPGEPSNPWKSSSSPTEPTEDIPWSCGFSGVTDIQCAFNSARTTENNQLGISLPMLNLPTQEEWDSMDNGEKALWLINQERVDRGVYPQQGTEFNVWNVAQTYGNYLLDNDLWGHYADGRSPWERLEDNPAIGACYDFLPVAENLAVFVSTGAIQVPVERSVYMWIYEDSIAAWGHRKTVLWYPYNDDNGLNEVEGFLGIGRASGGPYQGPFSNPWPFAEIIVMNVFDPCSTWGGDTDGDGIPDDEDNCAVAFNPNQIDTYPPQKNGIGDICECEGNFDCDDNQDGTDAATFKYDFGRNLYNRPCTTLDPCHGDFLCNGNVDGSDAALFKTDFGRNSYTNPCPLCEEGMEWCE